MEKNEINFFYSALALGHLLTEGVISEDEYCDAYRAIQLVYKPKIHFFPSEAIRYDLLDNRKINESLRQIAPNGKQAPKSYSDGPDEGEPPMEMSM